MCFSAQASFGASVVISAIGIVSMQKSVTKPQKVLSCIPLIFGAQQCAEGIVWLTLTHPGLYPWDKVATYVFLVFAQVVWPVIVPLSAWMMEKDMLRRKILSGFLVAGSMVGAGLGLILLFCPVQYTATCGHIAYDVQYPVPLRHLGILYLAVTVGPLVFSKTRGLQLLGITMLLAYIITRIFYLEYLLSVWCFFAAIMSAIVLSVIVTANSNKNHPEVLPG